MSAELSKDSLRTLICIPTYNERDNIEPIARAILANTPLGTDILFIDDGSPDGTGDVAEAMARTNPRIKVLHRTGKLGLGTAYILAFEWGLEENYDWFMEMDADFSHNPEHLPEFFRHIRGGKYDVICGSRYMQGGGVVNWDRRRYLLSRGGALYSRIWLRYPVDDWTGGFNAWNRQTLKEINLSSIHSKGYCFQIELRYRALELGKRLLEMPILFQERRTGKSKMSGSIIQEALLGVVRLRWRAEAGTLFI